VAGEGVVGRDDEWIEKVGVMSGWEGCGRAE